VLKQDAPCHERRQGLLVRCTGDAVYERVYVRCVARGVTVAGQPFRKQAGIDARDWPRPIPSAATVSRGSAVESEPLGEIV
jgi:hypothetical protein